MDKLGSMSYIQWESVCLQGNSEEKVNRSDGGKGDENKPVEHKPVKNGGTIQPTRPLEVEICKFLCLQCSA